MNPEDILISEAEFGQFVADQIEWLKERLNEKPKSMRPYLSILTADMDGKRGHTIATVAGSFNEHAEKREALMAIGRNTYENREFPLAIALSCEAWLAQNPPKGVEPRHCANKREVVLVCAQDISGKHTQMRSIAVKRDAQDQMEPDLEPPIIQPYQQARFPILEHFYRGFFEFHLRRS